MTDPNGWMPIETAPKDGTRALVWATTWAGEIGGVENNDGEALVASYSDGKSDYSGKGWWDIAATSGYAAWCKPTHWQPLPNPPGSLAGEPENVCLAGTTASAGGEHSPGPDASVPTGTVWGVWERCESFACSIRSSDGYEHRVVTNTNDEPSYYEHRRRYNIGQEYPHDGSARSPVQDGVMVQTLENGAFGLRVLARFVDWSRDTSWIPLAAAKEGE